MVRAHSLKRSINEKRTSQPRDQPSHKRRNSSVPCSSNSRLKNKQHEFDIDFLCDRTVEFMESGDTKNIISVELAEKSRYFERLFKYHIGKGTIKLPEFLNKQFSTVLEYIRCGKTKLDNNNVYDLFLAADYLLLHKLKSDCLEFIKEKLNEPSNSVTLWISTRKIFCEDLGTLAFEMILQNFEKVWKSSEFPVLSFSDVKLILSDDGLNCRSEMSVVKAIDKWISASTSRINLSFELSTCIRITLLSESERDALKSMHFIKNDSIMMNILENWPTFLTETNDDPVLEDFRTKVKSPRLPNEVVLVFGGWCDGQGPRAIAQVYDPQRNHWTAWTENSDHKDHLLGTIPKRVYARCVMVDSKVYIIGGFDGQTALKTTLLYDFDDSKSGWREISCMYEKRYYVSVAHADGYIYAIGGHSGEERGRLNTAERYNIKENLWNMISPMNRVRSDASAAELHEKVYVCGGFEGRRYHDSAEYYDQTSNHWTMVSRMNSPRGGVTLVRHANHLYALGGNDGVNRLRSIERYDPQTNQWESVGTMSQRKSNLSSAVINNDIYIIGGWSDEQHLGILSVVEKFNVDDKTCTPVSPLTFPASATCACVLSGKHRSFVSKYVIRDNESDGAGESNVNESLQSVPVNSNQNFQFIMMEPNDH